MEEIKQQALKGNLSWNGKKIVLDPFVPLEYSYEVETDENNALVVQLKLQGKYEALFTYGALQGSILRLFKEEIDPEWLFSSPEKLEGERKKRFLKECEDQIVWKNPPKSKDPLPILVLKDRTAAFADLWMEGEEGREATHGREMSGAEKFWEKDLLETDFIKKTVGTSHYYCPLDKVAKSLTFLLEVGWTLLDFQGKKMVKQGKMDLHASEGQGSILLRGKIKYGEHEVDASKVIGAFNRREQFLDLSSSEVGLIELPPAFLDLAEEEIIGDAIHVKRTHLGLLEGISPILVEWEQALPGSCFQGTLYPYQQKGVDFLSYLYRSHFHALLADEMGLGKTVQILAFLSTLEVNLPILIVMPTSLLFNWRKEIERFLPNMRGKIILTSYARLRLDISQLRLQEFEALILDEAQVIKNPESQVAKAACQLKSRFRLAVTGTPIENRFDDLKSIFRFLLRDAMDLSPIVERAKKQIRPFTLRRKKEEVALDLPERQEQIVWVEFEEEQRTFYDNWLKEHRPSLKLQAVQVFEAILRLRQICAHPRLVTGEYLGQSAKLERLLTDLDEVSGEKVLIYSQFTTMLRLIEKEVQQRGYRYVYLDGQTADREKVVAQFQDDPDVQIFLISLKAGGVGLNLTAADYVFLFDPWWNEAVENQAISRAHRIGRKKPVIARRYLATETIEEKMLKLKEKKLALAHGVLDFDEELKALSLEELQDLLQ